MSSASLEPSLASLDRGRWTLASLSGMVSGGGLAACSGLSNGTGGSPALPPSLDATDDTNFSAGSTTRPSADPRARNRSSNCCRGSARSKRLGISQVLFRGVSPVGSSPSRASRNRAVDWEMASSLRFALEWARSDTVLAALCCCQREYTPRTDASSVDVICSMSSAPAWVRLVLDS